VIAFLAGIKKRIHAEHGRDIYDLDGSNKKYQYLRRFINPFVTKWIPVSKELADWLVDVVKLPKAKVKLIYNGIDLELYRPKEHVQKETCVIGSVGRMAIVKDQLTLIKAAEVLVTENPELKQILRIVLVGDGELHSTIQGYIADHSLKDNVELLGARNDVACILQDFDVFVLPSLAEGIPLTILEAMATALPVISTEVGGVPELIENNAQGYLIKPKDVKGLATKIKLYIDKPELMAQHGASGREKVEKNFSLQAMTKQYLQIYAD
jgi:sugar transferase (PEP-CTERM/EpsH1 system associated)